jgi:glycosyltransferase involved in cell wall biosynthesis
MDKLYIVIPAYNEEANIDKVIRDWYPIVEKIGNGSRLVIIDDGSKDSTYQIMKKHAETIEAFEPVTKPNGGHGATVLYG